MIRILAFPSIIKKLFNYRFWIFNFDHNSITP